MSAAFELLKCDVLCKCYNLLPVKKLAMLHRLARSLQRKTAWKLCLSVGSPW